MWLSPYLVVNALCSYNWDLTIIPYFMCRNRNWEKVLRVIHFLSWILFIWSSGLSQQSHALLYFREFLQHLAHLGLIKLQTEKLRFLQNKIARRIVEKDNVFSGIQWRQNSEFWLLTICVPCLLFSWYHLNNISRPRDATEREQYMPAGQPAAAKEDIGRLGSAHPSFQCRHQFGSLLSCRLLQNL